MTITVGVKLVGNSLICHCKVVIGGRYLPARANCAVNIGLTFVVLWVANIGFALAKHSWTNIE